MESKAPFQPRSPAHTTARLVLTDCCPSQPPFQSRVPTSVTQSLHDAGMVQRSPSLTSIHRTASTRPGALTHVTGAPPEAMQSCNVGRKPRPPPFLGSGTGRPVMGN
ncbi:hypothetical protein NN561_005280 [Cricetulus griseus]